MIELELTRSAEQDLKAIARHTERRWGIRQRSIYLKELDQALRSLTRNPFIGRACDEVREGYRKLSHGSHVIYYKVAPDHVRVVRILHAMMDVEVGIGPARPR